MKKLLFRILLLLLTLVVLMLIYVAGVLIMNTANDYKPESCSHAYINTSKSPALPLKQQYSIISWNVGYGGLGADADFFYDGGNMVRPEKDEFEGYWAGLQKTIGAFDSLDFILLQEVDTASYRSYHINQYAIFSQILDSFNTIFLKNYDASFVPVPIFKPMARVVSGLVIGSKYHINSAEQVVFPYNYAWPKSLFMPDRCFMIASYDHPSGKQLHIINTHNSAFDDGSLRNAQVALLFEYMTSLYNDGDYVLAGGDWNINPPGYEASHFLSGDIPFRVDFSTDIFEKNDSWNVYFDQRYPTNRDVSEVYIQGDSPTTIIDFYVCSPNVRVLDITTLYQYFQYSDHQPVYFRFSLE